MDGNALQSYCPEDGSVKQVCAWEGDTRYAVGIAADNDVLLAGPAGSLADWRIISLADGSWRGFSLDGHSEIFDAEGDRILLFTEDGGLDRPDGAFYLLDCGTGGLDPVLRVPLGGEVMVTACLWDGALWYAASDGALHCVSLGSGKELAGTNIKGVAALAACDDFLAYAARAGHGGNSLAFYRLDRDGASTELGVWQDAQYAVNGSCVLAASADTVAAAVTTSDPKVFLCSAERTP